MLINQHPLFLKQIISFLIFNGNMKPHNQNNHLRFFHNNCNHAFFILSIIKIKFLNFIIFRAVGILVAHIIVVFLFF